MLFAALVLLLVTWSWWTTSEPQRGPAVAPILAGFEAVGDALDNTPRPLVLLLHEAGGDPLEALALLAGMTGARVLAPYGRAVAANGGRAFLDPGAAANPLERRLARRCQARAVGVELEAFLVAALLRWPTTRVIVVGLGEGGTLALQLGLTVPLVDTALAFGGAVDSALVPTAQRCSARLRKASWGAALSADRCVAQFARSRGFDFQVDALSDASGSAAFHWVLPQVQAALEKE